MKKRYDTFGDSECLTIIGTSIPTYAHALTVQFESRTIPTPKSDPFNLDARRVWLVEHIAMSRDLPADLVRPLLLSFLSLCVADNYSIGVTEQARNLWAFEEYREAYKSLLEMEYIQVDGISIIKFDPSEWRQWMADNDIEFVQPNEKKEG